MGKHTVRMTGYRQNLQAWFDHMHDGKASVSLDQQLHDDVVFHSPVVHTPQRGKAITTAYLMRPGRHSGTQILGMCGS